MLKHVKAQEKSVESMKRTAQKIMENASKSQEERDALANKEFKRRFRRIYARQCPPKQIRKKIIELRQDKKLPQNKKRLQTEHKRNSTCIHRKCFTS